MGHNYEFTCKHCQTKNYLNDVSKEETGKDLHVKCHKCKKANIIHLEPPKKKINKTIWIILIIIVAIFFFRGLFNESDNSSQLNLQNEKSILDTYCGDGSCNSNEDCASCPSDCGLCEKDVLSNIKKTIVWVKYDVVGKNVDGSYFENGGTGSGVIVGNKNNELTIYTNRHVVDCEYNDIHCFQRISETIQVRTQDGKIHKVDKVSFSKSDIDLAILTIKTSNSDDYPFAYYTDKFDINDKVIAVGYPAYAQNVVEFSVSEGKITNIKELLSQSTGDAFRAIESDVYTYFGSSGGGLFDKQGNLIGINTWLAGTQTSIAIDFSSITEKNFVYCSDDAYFANGNCYNLCDREQVMDYKNRVCYDACKEFYCNSQVPPANDQRCRNAGYILGSDGYCHQPCASSNSYCQTGSICLRNRCYPPCSYGYLWEDGTCRVYE